MELPNVIRHCLWVRGSLRLVAVQQAGAPQIQAPCGEATIAVFSVLPEEVPQDVMEKSPSPPQLGKMVMQLGRHLCVPDELIKKWYHDPIFGSRFRAFLDEFYEEPARASLSGLSRAIVLVT